MYNANVDYNSIGPKGTKALAEMMTSNTMLNELSLSMIEMNFMHRT